MAQSVAKPTRYGPPNPADLPTTAIALTACLWSVNTCLHLNPATRFVTASWYLTTSFSCQWKSFGDSFLIGSWYLKSWGADGNGYDLAEDFTRAIRLIRGDSIDLLRRIDMHGIFSKFIVYCCCFIGERLYTARFVGSNPARLPILFMRKTTRNHLKSPLLWRRFRALCQIWLHSSSCMECSSYNFCSENKNEFCLTPARLVTQCSLWSCKLLQLSCTSLFGLDGSACSCSRISNFFMNKASDCFIFSRTSTAFSSKPQTSVNGREISNDGKIRSR